MSLDYKVPVAAYHIMRKDLRIFFRDRTAMIFTFALPILFTLIFGAAFNHSSSDEGNSSIFRVLVADQDSGKHGAELIAAMGQVGLKVEQAASPQQATDRVKRGDLPLGVVIPPDFSAQLDQAVQQVSAGSPNPSQARLSILVDPAQAQIAGMAQGAIFAAIQRVTGPLFRAASLERVPAAFRPYAAKTMEAGSGRPTVALDMVQMTHKKPGEHDPTPGDRMMPGLSIYFIFFLANGVAVTLIVERQEGTLRRMMSAPLPPGQILFGKLLARVMVGLLQVALLFGLGYYMLRFSLNINPGGQILIALACIFAAVGMGLLIAALGRTQEQIQGMTTLVLLLMGFLSGCLIPRALLPEVLQKLSFVTPHAWALDAYNDILLRKMSLVSALPALSVVVVFGLVFFGLALVRFRYE